MASKKVEFKMEWENNVSFEFSLKLEGGSWIPIIEVHENTSISEMTSPLRNLCIAVFNQHLEKALKEMEQS